MKTLSALCFTLVMTLGCVYPTQAHKTTSNTQLIEGGYTVSVPQGVDVAVKSPVEDFVLYQFSLSDGSPGLSSKKQRLLTLYIGNQPFTNDNIADIKQCKDVLPEGFLARCKKTKGKAGGLNGDVYIEFAQDAGWPLYAHFFYKGAQSEKIAMINQIISSFSSASQQH